MSASEKLAVLEAKAEARSNWGDWNEVAGDLIDALPEIRALTDEAEAFCADCGACNGGVTTEPDWSDGRCPNCGHVRVALAALASKLGERE